MDSGRRKELLRYGAPVAFLAAATIAVLLIKAGLGGGGSSALTATSVATSSRAPSTTSVTTATTITTGTTTAARYYTIQSGDTFGSVALKEHTTVDALLRLNPGVDPTTLHVGQRIRVG